MRKSLAGCQGRNSQLPDHGRLNITPRNPCEFTIDEVLSLTPDALWRETRTGGAIDRAYFDRYFEGRDTAHALRVKQARRYRSPLCLRADFGIDHPPQSFCYLD